MYVNVTIIHNDTLVNLVWVAVTLCYRTLGKLELKNSKITFLKSYIFNIRLTSIMWMLHVCHLRWFLILSKAYTFYTSKVEENNKYHTKHILPCIRISVKRSLWFRIFIPACFSLILHPNSKFTTTTLCFQPDVEFSVCWNYCRNNVMRLICSYKCFLGNYTLPKLYKTIYDIH